MQDQLMKGKLHKNPNRIICSNCKNIFIRHQLLVLLLLEVGADVHGTMPAIISQVASSQCTREKKP